MRLRICIFSSFSDLFRGSNTDTLCIPSFLIRNTTRKINHSYFMEYILRDTDILPPFIQNTPLYRGYGTYAYADA
jgi:hypothetical protein